MATKVELNHTIVHARDKHVSAKFLSEMLELPDPIPFFGGYFMCVPTTNGVTLDFCDVGDYPFVPQHYAFLVSDKEWDEIFARIQARGLDYWADPGKKSKGKINHHDGGKGCYFEDPSGHFLEIITKPYGKS